MQETWRYSDFSNKLAEAKSKQEFSSIFSCISFFFKVNFSNEEGEKLLDKTKYGNWMIFEKKEF